MTIWTKSAACLLLVWMVSACASAIYREEFNWNAVYTAYSRYSIVAEHPFDSGSPQGGPEPLLEALDGQLRARGLQEALPDEARDAQLVFAFNDDIQAGRLRIKTIAAQSAVTWSFQLARESDDPSLLALEVWERQSGNLLYRAEARRAETTEETVEKLLSRFPPNTKRFRLQRQ